jgi:hypothetical protein
MHLSGRKGDIYVERGSAFTDFFNSYVENADGRNTWIPINGKWNVTNYKYSGEGGLVYHNVGQLDSFKFSGTITNISGVTGGEIFAVPGSPVSLAAFWPFDNATGSKAYDWSGNSINGTLTNMNTTGNATSGWTTDCKFGSCLKFDGVNDYVDAGANLINGKTAFTVSAWAKAGYMPSDGSPVNRIIAGHDTGYGALFFVESMNAIYCRFDNSTTAVSKNIAFDDETDNIWHFWTCTIDTSSDGYVRIYEDGILVGTSTSKLIGTLSESGNFKIGGDGDNRQFNGTIDEVKIWNRTLTANEVKAEYYLSTRKLAATGDIDFVAQNTNVTIVLANPDGKTNFDDIKVNDDDKEMKLILSYSNIDLNGTGRFPKGEHQVTIEHMGTNSTLGKPTIEISSA